MKAKLYSYRYGDKSAQLWANNHKDAVMKFKKAFFGVNADQVKETTSDKIAEEVAQNMLDKLNLSDEPKSDI